jgi:hypothetical protein
MNIIQEYIENENRNAIISKFLEQGAWNWILHNVGLYDFKDDTANQIGKAYIGPNENFSDDPEECKDNWGYTWNFTNDKKHIRITYNTIKNQYLDINEDNEVILTFDEFLKYI